MFGRNITTCMIILKFGFKKVKSVGTVLEYDCNNAVCKGSMF